MYPFFHIFKQVWKKDFGGRSTRSFPNKEILNKQANLRIKQNQKMEPKKLKMFKVFCALNLKKKKKFKTLTPFIGTIINLFIFLFLKDFVFSMLFTTQYPTSINF